MTQDVIAEPLGDEQGSAAADVAPQARAGRPDRRRRRRLVALGAAGVAGLAWLGWASPLTLVEHVRVSAPRGISEESVRLASGISAQDHVPAVDAEKVRVAIMTALPAVAGVEVSRSLPDTITLAVTVREPFAAVDAGKGYYVLDSTGIVFDKVGSVKKLPLISARTEVGREEARAVLLSLPKDLRVRVKRITAKTRDDVTLTLRGGATVRWGNVADADLKARVLAGLLAVKADRYDVSAPLQPTTSGGAAAEEAASNG
jgi:cell division protein FtsQ